MRRAPGWAAVASANLSAMTLYLWHQTAFLAVSAAGLLAGRPPGLLTAPAGAAWISQRLAWLPVFAVVLAGLWLVFHGIEHAGPRRRDHAAAATTALALAPIQQSTPGGADAAS